MTIFLFLIILIYAIFVIDCTIKLATKKDTTPNDNPNQLSTMATIAIAAKNEEENIVTLMQSIVNQNVSNIKTIIADDHSTDHTPILIEYYAKRTNSINLINNLGNGKKAALDTILTQVATKYILQTDADCDIPQNWACNMITTAENEHADMVLGPVILTTPNPNSLFQKMWQMESLSIITITAGTCINNRPTMANGANMLYNTQLRQSTNLNNNYSSGDDMFLLENFQLKHRKISYCVNAPIFTPTPTSLKQLLQQRARWISKTNGYKNIHTKAVALLVFLANISLFLTGILTVLNMIEWHIFVVAFCIKTIADISSIAVAANRFEQYNIKINPPATIALALCYPIYILAVLATKCFNKNKW